MKFGKKSVNFDIVEFLPQKRIILEFSFEQVNQKDFNLIAATYRKGVKGTFLFMLNVKKNSFFMNGKIN